jgi:RNA polymerase sigma factor (sigma-70 family)
MTPQPAGIESRTSRRAVGARVSALFDENAAMVLGLCRLLLRDHHEAEDACQQTFVSAYRALLRGTEPRDVGPWLAAIARNECRARMRRRMRAPIALDADIELELADTQDLAELADRRAELSQLASEIARLPSRQREAIALRDFLGLSYEEVASTLSVSVPVVESLLFRARRRLRDTVRRVPRYAAGFIVVPFALRAAVARDVPDFGSPVSSAGLAATAGAAAGGIAKLLSLPFGVKVAATTAALVAAGSVVAPTLIHKPAQGPAPGAQVAAGASGSDVAHATPDARAGGGNTSRAAGDQSGAQAGASAAASGSSSGSASAAGQSAGGGTHEQHPSASDSARTSASEPGQTLPTPAPQECPPATPPASDASAATSTGADPAATAPAATACPPPGDGAQPGAGSGSDGGTATDPSAGGAESDGDSTVAPPPPPPPPPSDTAPATTTPPPPPPPPPGS